MLFIHPLSVLAIVTEHTVTLITFSGVVVLVVVSRVGEGGGRSAQHEGLQNEEK